jgi:hypothetical protein|tara:strand:- start:259 stop:459 length:201 start_codon:yes stop_codon:yes gene_type:complete
MSSAYKENNFSTENPSTLQNSTKYNTNRPNIDHLIKRIIVERRREKKNIITFGAVCFLVILMFYFA